MKFFERDKNAGFTLLEVLIALTIFAVAASGLLFANGESIKNAVYLEDKTLATWIAENKISELRVLGIESINDLNGIETFAGRDWLVELKAERSNIAKLDRVTVIVSLQESAINRAPLSQLTSYLRTEQ